MEQQQLSPMDTNNSASSTTLSEIPATVLDESSGPGVSEASEVILSDVVHRRTSLRPRRAAVAEGSFISDKELDVLLAEPSQSTPSMAQANDAPGRDASDEFEKWVEVEQILKIRRTAPFHDRSTPETLGCRAEQYAYFVKFRDQSYWHCDWIPGQTILFMHPGMVKNYHKRNQELVDLVDQEYRDLQSGHETLNVLSPKLPSSDDDSTVDDTSAAESTNIAPIIGGKLAMSLLDTQPKRGRRRYRYYLENGVPFSYLYPETVLEIGDVFQPTTLSQCRHRGRNRAKKSTIYSAHLREVLVKWTQLDEGQATWETVEMDLAHLEVMLPKYRRAGFIPLDPCGRRLLPTFVRRWILQLVDAHLTQVASLYSSHLGDASDKLLELVAGGRAKTRQRSPPPEWQ
uniref:Chromo domain-containing protein n=1 Tax=Mesocestoides corti TaxID=53468 RepID=A0A5K3FYD4_MESCO